MLSVYFIVEEEEVVYAVSVVGRFGLLCVRCDLRLLSFVFVSFICFLYLCVVSVVCVLTLPFYVFVLMIFVLCITLLFFDVVVAVLCCVLFVVLSYNVFNVFEFEYVLHYIYHTKL